MMLNGREKEKEWTIRVGETIIPQSRSAKLLGITMVIIYLCIASSTQRLVKIHERATPKGWSKYTTLPTLQLIVKECFLTTFLKHQLLPMY